jgi:hypothetical protein
MSALRSPNGVQFGLYLELVEHGDQIILDGHHSIALIRKELTSLRVYGDHFVGSGASQYTRQMIFPICGYHYMATIIHPRTFRRRGDPPSRDSLSPRFAPTDVMADDVGVYGTK